jgi:transposase
MLRKIAFVGLDVHKDTITVAMAEGTGPALKITTITHDVPRLVRSLRKIQKSGYEVRCCYEAGPTGFGLYRKLNESGISCEVIAPSLVPKRSGNRIKTDRRDAVNLAHYYRSGDLTPIRVPDENTEAIRDLERAREDAKKAEKVARSHLTKFLLRQDRHWTGRSYWTKQHMEWIRSQKFEQEAHQWVLVDYIEALQRATQRVDELTQRIAEQVETWSLQPLVKALQSFRGVQLVTAVVIAAELGDLKRFRKASELMAYIGLVPAEQSSGERTQRGRITRTGNEHVRWILVEAAWHYRFKPTMSQAIRKRNEGVAPGVRQIAWAAQKRLHLKYSKLRARGKEPQKVVTSVARELCGFIWAVGQEKELLAS